MEQEMGVGQFIGVMLCVCIPLLSLLAVAAGPRWMRQRRERLQLRPAPRQYARAGALASVGGMPAPAHFPLPQPAQMEHAPVVQRIDIATIARSLNVAIVGPKDSGKTTLIGELIKHRAGYVEALDIHNEPGKWQCSVFGGGEQFDVVHAHLQAAYKTMQARYLSAEKGERRQAEYQSPAWRIGIVGDEWGGIVGELVDQRAKGDKPAVMGAGALLGKLIARGRKVGIGLIVAAHDDTAAQFGLDGEMGLMASFDFICYLGGAATGNTAIPIEVRQAARKASRPAVALDTNSHTWFILDTRLAVRDARTSAAPMPQDLALILEMATSVPDNRLSPFDNVLQPVLSEFQASQREVALVLSVAKPIVSPEEVALITVKLQQGIKPGAVAKSLRGYNGRNYQEYKSKVDYVSTILGDLGEVGTNEESPDMEPY